MTRAGLIGLSITLALLLVQRSAVAQTEIISPRDSGILQLRNGKGELHLIARAASDAKRMQFRLLDSLGRPLPGFDWQPTRINAGRIDTVLRVPVLRQMQLQWQTDAATLDGGLLTGLAVGHLFGILGQSNAQGWSPGPYQWPRCDARMMWHDLHWSLALDPTGEKWGSPWIAFANKFSELLHDGLPIGIINAAVGGTGLSVWAEAGQWKRNDEIHDDTATLYGTAITRFRAAGNDLEAVFWIQGENDAVGTTVQNYQRAFSNLYEDLVHDLGFPVSMFHMQIGGQIGNDGKVSWGVVREALRTLPHSTLVGSTIGLPLSTDGIHYSAMTALVVGERFAGAVADELYGVKNGLYPPPVPLGNARLVRCTSRDPETGWKIEVQAMKGAKPCKLSGHDPIEGFQLTVDASLFDTSKVYSRIDPDDSSKIDLFLKAAPLYLNPTWRVSYGIAADVSNLTLSDGDELSADLPNMFVAFLNLPVYDSVFATSVAGSRQYRVAQLLPPAPNPATTMTVIPYKLSEAALVSMRLYDELGRVVSSNDLGVQQRGDHLAEIPCSTLAAGSYRAIFKLGKESASTRFVVVR